MFLYSSKWTINKINYTTGQTIESIILPANVNLNTSNLNLPLNGSLAYGVYQVFYQLTLLSSNSQLNTSTFIKVLPANFNVLGFIGEKKQIIGPFDSIVFSPSFFSFDPNGMISPLTLNYQFYCISTHLNSNQSSNWNQMFNSIQKSSLNSCFESPGNKKLKSRLFYTL